MELPGLVERCRHGEGELSMPTPHLAQDYTALARKYEGLAEDPTNASYREQFLDLARVWMEFAMEEEGKPPSPRLA